MSLYENLDINNLDIFDFSSEESDFMALGPGYAKIEKLRKEYDSEKDPEKRKKLRDEIKEIAKKYDIKNFSEDNFATEKPNLIIKDKDLKQKFTEVCTRAVLENSNKSKDWITKISKLKEIDDSVAKKLIEDANFANSESTSSNISDRMTELKSKYKSIWNKILSIPSKLGIEDKENWTPDEEDSVIDELKKLNIKDKRDATFIAYWIFGLSSEPNEFASNDPNKAKKDAIAKKITDLEKKYRDAVEKEKKDGKKDTPQVKQAKQNLDKAYKERDALKEFASEVKYVIVFPDGTYLDLNKKGCVTYIKEAAIFDDKSKAEAVAKKLGGKVNLFSDSLEFAEAAGTPYLDWIHDNNIKNIRDLKMELLKLEPKDSNLLLDLVNLFTSLYFRGNPNVNLFDIGERYLEMRKI